jgi:hypothetical protein
LKEQENLYVHCGGGYRSLNTSILKKRGALIMCAMFLGSWSKIKKKKKSCDRKKVRA